MMNVEYSSCPICLNQIPVNQIQSHVNYCLKESPQPIRKPLNCIFSIDDLKDVKQSIEKSIAQLCQNLGDMPPIFHTQALDIYISLENSLQRAQMKLKSFHPDINIHHDIDINNGILSEKLVSGDIPFDINNNNINNNQEEQKFLIDPPSLFNGEIDGEDNQNDIDQQEEERLFQEFLRGEMCGVCSNIPSSEAPFEIGTCGHKVCQNCMKNHCTKLLNQKIPSLRCPVSECNHDIPQWIFKMILPDDTVEKLMNAALQGLLASCEDFASCPKCGFTFERVASMIEVQPIQQIQQETDVEGRPLNEMALNHKAKYRFRCQKCATIFCSACQEVPYHLGYSCDSWKHYLNSRKCRFCIKALTNQNYRPSNRKYPPGLEDVCIENECQEKRKKSCGKLLPCKHLCHGICCEKKCLPCLDEECSNGKYDKEDYCNICWAESLESSPCIQLSCSHIFHLDCVNEKIIRRWPGARITFGYLKCPLCKEMLNHPAINLSIKEDLKLLEEVSNKAIQRLKFENMDHAPALEEKGGKYFHKPVEYALDKFAYYPCFKCKKPYFGGARACEEAARQEAEQYDPSHLVCGGCSDMGMGKDCKIHGKDYIEFKCKFCCNIATWFCWGNTHFCDKCHKQQASGTYLTKIPRNKLPKCIPSKCPLQGKHPLNGEEYTIGCVICKQMQAF